ncbi:MAG: protein TolR [Deltaproteobacteria bacterium]|nr:protein TolR [Deltaproteobacteria bacterium]
MSSGGRGGPVSDINVTPLVDVMLVLLIIFMVTAPLISQGVDVDLPKTNAQPLEGNEEKLVLTITKEKKIYVGSNADNAIPLDQLVEKLRNNEKLRKERELFLHADRGLDYGFVVDVMVKLKEAGVENLGMVTDPLDPSSVGTK